MGEIAHEEDRPSGLRIEIVYDDDPTNPRKDYDPAGTMVCWAGDRYSVGDQQPSADQLTWLMGLAFELYDQAHINRIHHKKGDDWAELGEMSDWELSDRVDEDDGVRLIDKILQRTVMLQLFIYIHSGITMSSGPFIAYDRRSRPDGVIYMTQDEVVKEFGGFTTENIEKAQALLKAEVETYDLYLTGQCYGFRILGPAPVDDDDEPLDDEREELDTCWGFLGSIDECLEEARSAAEIEERHLPIPRSMSLVPLAA